MFDDQVPINPSEAAGPADPTPRPSGQGGAMYEQLDASVRRLLVAVGLPDATPEASAAIAAYARRVSPEVFEAWVTLLGEVLPIWRQLVRRRRYRITQVLVDEYLWFLRNTRARHASPDELATHCGFVSVLEFTCELARRLT